MNIEYMDQSDQIMFQDAKMVNQHYSISWLASSDYQDILVCIKSSWLSYDRFIQELRTNDKEDKFAGQAVYWEKVTGQTSLQVFTNIMMPPVDVILLPINHNKVLVPKNEESCIKLQKTVKGTIRYVMKKERSFIFSRQTTVSLTFLNSTIPSGKEIVAEYIVDHLRYPVTAEMLGQKINIQIPKYTNCQPVISNNMAGKYNLIVSED